MTTTDKTLAADRLPRGIGRKESEKRKETRYPTNESAEVRLLYTGRDPIRAKIVNVSRSGMRLEVASALPQGRRIEITTSSRKLVVFGEIRYCKGVSGGFHVGVLIEGVVSDRDGSVANLSGDEIASYIARQGVTTPEAQRASEHLSKCGMCLRRIPEM
jgi:hypothetical protein